MLLKRIYDDRGALAYISVAHTGIAAEQNFSVSLVTKALQEGWMELHEGQLVLKGEPENLVYAIRRQPGRYCLHCGEKLPDDEGGALSRLHVAARHRGLSSPDPGNPGGYEKLNHFECVLAQEQHERLRLRNKARAPHFPRKEV
jgi:hypothetical protein